MADINSLDHRIREEARAELKRELENVFGPALQYCVGASFNSETILYRKTDDGQFHPVPSPYHALSIIQEACLNSIAPAREDEAIAAVIAQFRNEHTTAKLDADALETIINFLHERTAALKEAGVQPSAADWNALVRQIKGATKHREEW